jgi:hypothetical protein
MNEADNWETRTGRVADRGPATIGVPPKDLAGKAEAAHGVSARGQLHAARWQMEDICPARRIEHVWPIEKARKCLTVLAVAKRNPEYGATSFATPRTWPHQQPSGRF